MYQLGYFRCDVTPPIGHPLCGGWITPATQVVDRQWANGFVLTGDVQPIVVVAVDWCEIRNAAYDQWREGLASATGTTPERVFVHTVHQHDAPLADPEADVILREHGIQLASTDVDFLRTTIAKVGDSARAALDNLQPVTHISTGQAEVEQVASNRRIMKDANGVVTKMRGSACNDPDLRAATEGLIDPYLKTIGFWNGEKQLLALHYYATHPMSHYGKGMVSSDFCGLAREQLAAETGIPQIYFTGGAGNIAAGKYNDGKPETRPVLSARIADGMRRSLQNSKREPLKHVAWEAVPVGIGTRAQYPLSSYQDWLQDETQGLPQRGWAAMGIVWHNRVTSNSDVIDVTCLHLNDARIVHLPGEPFVEYQLFAQQSAPERFVAFAGYGDGGTGYIPTRAAYAEGGYETSWVALTSEQTETALNKAIEKLVRA